MVDKKIADIHYRHLFAKNIANNLDIDKRDEKGKDSFIIADVWNEFATGKGNGVRFGLGVNTAVKSISTYLYNEAIQSGALIADIGDTWEKETSDSIMFDGGTIKSRSRDIPLADKNVPAPETNSKKPKPKTNNKSTTDNTAAAKKTAVPKKKTTKKVEKQPIEKQPVEKQTQAAKKDVASIEPTETDASKNIYKTDKKYSKMSRKKANDMAKKDPRLEQLTGGKGWVVNNGSFRTDVKYARKYTGKILSYIAQITGAELIVTSALGTGQYGNPHQRSGYASHHNAENPKLDLKASNYSLKQLQIKLKETGFFSRVSRERTHLDVQIKPEVYLAFEQNLTGEQVSQILKDKSLSNQRLA